MKTKKAKHVSVVADDGTNYRLIAETMTDLGFKMNHSSVHNHVLRILRKFAEAYINELDVSADEAKLMTVIKSTSFQDGLAEILRDIEAQRRKSMT